MRAAAPLCHPGRLLARVGRNLLGRGEPRRALELAERALALEAESGLGLREAVDERYERLRGLLAERLGLEPDRETRSLPPHPP